MWRPEKDMQHCKNPLRILVFLSLPERLYLSFYSTGIRLDLMFNCFMRHTSQVTFPNDHFVFSLPFILSLPSPKIFLLKFPPFFSLTVLYRGTPFYAFCHPRSLLIGSSFCYSIPAYFVKDGHTKNPTIFHHAPSPLLPDHERGNTSIL